MTINPFLLPGRKELLAQLLEANTKLLQLYTSRARVALVAGQLADEASRTAERISAGQPADDDTPHEVWEAMLDMRVHLCLIYSRRILSALELDDIPAQTQQDNERT